VEAQLQPEQEDAEEGNGRLLGNADERVVNKENDPPSKRYTKWTSCAYYV
jgi:hypothetical protein